MVRAVLHQLVEHPGADCRRYPLPRVDAGVYPHGGLVAAPALAHLEHQKVASEDDPKVRNHGEGPY